MTIILLIIILYVIALFAISFYANKLAGSENEGFVLAGRKLTTPLVAVTITGLAIGGASTIGVSEQAFDVGLSAGWYNVAWGAGAICMGLLAAKKYRKLNITTVPEFFERFYDKKSRIACVIGQIIIQIAITSLQYIAGGAMLTSMLPSIFSLKTGILFSSFVFIGITCVGGMMTAGLTNILNIILIYTGIIISAITIIIKGGGMESIIANLPKSIPYMHPIKGLGGIVIFSWFAVMITQCLSCQGVVQIALSAKDEKTARNGFVIGGLMMLPIGFIAALIGIAAKAIYPDINATVALPKIIMSLSPILAGITLAALWAADVSTACSLLLGSATLLSQDIYKRFINPSADSKKLGRVNKISTAVLGLFTVLLAMNASGILKTISIALSLTTAFSITLLFTIFTPGFCRKNSAFYTTIAGAAALVLWQFIPQTRFLPHVIYLEWLVCGFTFPLVSLFDREKIVEKELEVC
ncbi:sodium:solute symporter family protein [Clostridium colicanis]|uniref:Putative symporter YidK n=1 Tax=Clostridium colicanis DSM 13634 TaxID=1121305 RepID=A0A151AKA9_9CLOT|nr:sodium:solute symporter family protein [Clostridium colicanis]KYH28078.1 putative symporter YidK [Clostridium colicanis DSM 13634]